jgi:mannose-1-phosphate guanylyltransferase/mannose-6-phosphate isomerase
LEKASGLKLIPAEFVWDDIGNWSALERSLQPDPHDNFARGPHLALQSSGCVFYSDAGVVAAFGVSDLVIVQAHGKVLVCPKDKASELKRLVAAVGPEEA